MRPAGKKRNPLHFGVGQATPLPVQEQMHPNSCSFSNENHQRKVLLDDPWAAAGLEPFEAYNAARHPEGEETCIISTALKVAALHKSVKLPCLKAPERTRCSKTEL